MLDSKWKNDKTRLLAKCLLLMMKEKFDAIPADQEIVVEGVFYDPTMVKQFRHGFYTWAVCGGKDFAVSIDVTRRDCPMTQEDIDSFTGATFLLLQKLAKREDIGLEGTLAQAMEEIEPLMKGTRIP